VSLGKPVVYVAADWKVNLKKRPRYEVLQWRQLRVAVLAGSDVVKGLAA
jgi:hypothetical protein